MSGSPSQGGGAIVDFDPLKFYEVPTRSIATCGRPRLCSTSSLAALGCFHATPPSKPRRVDRVTFTSARGTDLFDYSLGPGDFLDLDPPRHGEPRRIVRPDFLPSKLKLLRSQVRRAVDKLVDSLLEGETSISPAISPSAFH